MTNHTHETAQHDNRWKGTIGTVLLLSIALVAGMAAFAPTAAADGHCSATVNDGESIQAAIDAATAGDTICINEGTYEEALDIQGLDDLTLEGAGSDLVTIDASEESGRSIDVGGSSSAHDSNIALEGFTLLGGDDYGLKAAFIDGFTVEDVVVTESANTGLDLHTVDNADIEGIEAAANGGNGITVRNGTGVTLTNVTTDANAWGGLAFYAPSDETVENVVVTDSQFSNEAAGVYLQYDGFTAIQIDNATFSGNDVGLGLFDNFPGTPEGDQLTVIDNTFEDNGIHAVSDDGSLDLDAILADNTIDKLVRVNGDEDVNGALLGSIQAAIDQASAGDQISPDAATYEEAITVDVNDVTLLGQEGVEIAADSATAGDNDVPTLEITAEGASVEDVDVNRTVDEDAAAGQGHTEAILVGANDVSLVNVTAALIDQSGDGGFFGLDDQGSAIYADGVTGLSLDGVTAENDIRTEDGTSGAALSIVDADATIEASVLTSSGRGLWASGASNIDVSNSTISLNDEGVVNDGDNAIIAPGNYWGSPTGPSADDNALPLTGASIEGDVEYRPWCVEESCLATTDGGESLLSDNYYETVVSVDGQGECRIAGYGGASDDAGAGVFVDPEPVQTNSPDALASLAALDACANAAAPDPEGDRGFLGIHTPDEGTLSGTVIVLGTQDQGTITGTLDLDADHLASLTWYTLQADEERSAEPTTSIEGDGACRYDRGGGQGAEDSGTVTLFDDDAITDVQPPSEQNVFDAALACLEAAGRLDTPSHGYLTATIDVADGALTVTVTTVQLTNGASALAGL